MNQISSLPALSVQHVRVHLLPYLGGDAALAALRTDSPNDGACAICFADEGTATGLSSLRASLPAKQREAYDVLEPCYHRLADRIMTRLPVDRASVWLMPQAGSSPYDQTVQLFKHLFESQYFDAMSCRV